MEVSVKERQLPTSRIVIVLAVSIAMLLVGATMVLANHNFSDVPTSAFYHSAVDWGVDRGLISGCGSGKFCPNDPITRGQAMFIMKGLADVVSPHVLTSEAGPTSVDIDSASPVIVCPTATWRRSYEETVFGFARTTMDPAVTPLAYVGKVAYKVAPSGAWTIMPPVVSTTSQSNTANEDIFNAHFSSLNLAPNTTYQFGIKLEPRDALSSGDSAPDGSYSCALVMQFFNRNV
jgi:hypothetical protein